MLGCPPGSAACTVRGPRASGQPWTLVSSSAVSQHQAPCPCCASSPLLLKQACSCPGYLPRVWETTQRQWVGDSIVRGKPWLFNLGTQVSYSSVCYSLGRLLDLSVPQFSIANSWGFVRMHHDHVYKVLNVILSKYSTIILSNTRVDSITYPSKGKSSNSFCFFPSKSEKQASVP